jgi:predicted DNA binding protein
MVVSNVSVGSNWQVYTIYTSSSSSPITISDNSTLAIYNSSMVVSNVSVGSSWYVYTIYTSSSSPINISTNSTLAIYNSAMVVSNVSVGSNWQVYTVYTSPSSPITISDNSTLAIYNSAMVVSNVSVGSNWQVYTIYIEFSSITISTSSTFAIYNSTMVVSNVSVGTTLRPSLIGIRRGSVLVDYSTVTIFDNHVDMAHVVSGILEFFSLLLFEYATLKLTRVSTFAIVNSSATVLNVAAREGKWQWITVSILNSITVIEDLSYLNIHNISIIVSNMTVSGQWGMHVLGDVYSPISIRNGSTLSISRNTIGLRDMMVGGDGLVALVLHKLLLITLYQNMHFGLLKPFECYYIFIFFFKYFYPAPPLF